MGIFIYFFIQIIFCEGICLDEFGYWYGPAEYGQLGTRSSLKDALGVAVAIHAMMRNGT
jgi:hypothetical protein